MSFGYASFIFGNNPPGDGKHTHIICPIESVTLKKREKTEELFARYNALHESDREKILHYEDLIKAKTKLDGTVRAFIQKNRG